MFPELAEAMNAVIDLLLLATDPNPDVPKIHAARGRLTAARAKLTHLSGS